MIEKNIHLERRWRVDEIAGDFHLWDVWQFPIEANNSDKENFQTFQKILFISLESLAKKVPLTGFLFSLRHIIAKIIPLDKNINSLPIPGCSEISLKSRLTGDDIKKSKEGKPIKDKDFGLEILNVYLFENEALYELSNDTVHGLLHLGWYQKSNKLFSSTLAIYVKPRGILGKYYLKLIEPFRHYLVYPVLMKSAKKHWNDHKMTSGDMNLRRKNK